MFLSFAAVSCSHHWTAACDVMQARMDASAPYLYSVLAIEIVVLLAALIHRMRATS